MTSEEVGWITVEGEPVAKERPRVTRTGTYTPPRTAQAEQVIAWKFRQAAPHHRPDPVAEYALHAVFYCRTRRARTDIDNLVKLIMDALNGVAWKDDRQVATVVAHRMTDPVAPRTEFGVCRLDITGRWVPPAAGPARA